MLAGVWLSLIAVLWAGLTLLKGFELGAGSLIPLLPAETERDTALRTVGLLRKRDGLWLLAVGAITVAVFPKWIASLSGSVYPAFVAVAMPLVGILLRNAGIWYRHRVTTGRARRSCDAAIGLGSAVPAASAGIVAADLVRGVRLGSEHVFAGGLVDLVSPYALLGGLTTLTLFALCGALFLAFRAPGPTGVRARNLSRPISWASAPLVALLLLWSSAIRASLLSELLALLIIVAVVAAVRFAHGARYALGFAATSIAAALLPAWVFASSWPYVLPASNDARLSLTARAASWSSHPLTVLVAPLVLATAAGTYRIFRRRVQPPVHHTVARPSAGWARPRGRRA